MASNGLAGRSVARRASTGGVFADPRHGPRPPAALARAKINLALHVTGRRADGYHLLDSLVVFADLGDRLTIRPGGADACGALSLELTGPMAAGLADTPDNLVLRAARLLQAGREDLPPAVITLDKHLPVASGIGGGSADAAAALRLAAEFWRMPLPEAAAVLSLGADVPVCLAGHAARMSGIGEQVTALSQPLPAAWLVLVNPGQAVSTPAVFGAVACRDNPPLPALHPWADAAALADWLRGCRNDLEAPALALCPAIGAVLAALAAQPGCLIARMSGSGATCFGLFAEEQQARAAVARLLGERAAGDSRDQPGDWWVAAAPLLRA
jgi:4-diphosphocytidyl-2-C-methyl-D-erythritol kinase